MRLPASLAFLITASAVHGQPAPAATDESADSTARQGDIVVIATRINGQVDAPQAPVMVLDEGDITAYGAGSIADLIEAISPQTGTGRGRGGGHPVILMNGQRISSFREFRNIPPEAISRMEVLPEEVALRFGFAPNQKVINFILKNDFSSRSLDGEYRLPELGGFAEHEIEATFLKFGKSSRFNLNAVAKDTSPLFEAERETRQDAATLPGVASDPDPATARSLIADTRELSLTGSWSGGLGEGGAAGSLALNGSITRNDSRSYSGFNTVTLTDPLGSSLLRTLGDPLARKKQTVTLAGGAAYNTAIRRWQLSATVDASHTDTRSLIDRRADLSGLVTAAAAGALAIDGPLPAPGSSTVDRTRTRTLSVNSLVTLSGSLLQLPAGEVATTFKAGFEHSAIRSHDSRLAGSTRLIRNDRYAGTNMSIPLASRRNNVLAGIGDLSINLSAGVASLSDVGALADWSAGLTWSPVEALSLQASWFVNQQAPELADLGSPATQSFNVPVYDFRRGETALVTITDGGYPALRKERQRDLKLSAQWNLPGLRNSSLLLEWNRNRSDNVTSAFPLLSVPIEDAFPGRVVRDASGRLVSIDRRAITLAQTTGSRLRWGLNLSGSLGAATSGPRGFGAPPAGGHVSMGGPMGRDGKQGRWNLSIYHTVRFTDRVLVAPGGPRLDLLGGDALSGGGSVRNGLEIEGGGFYRGFGLRMKGGWTGPSHLRASGLPGTSNLRFGSVFDVNLRAFINFDMQKRLIEHAPFLKGVRLAFNTENLFASRQKVTDASGATPLSYQKDFLDPRGRVFEIDLRKAF